MARKMLLLTTGIRENNHLWRAGWYSGYQNKLCSPPAFWDFLLFYTTSLTFFVIRHLRINKNDPWNCVIFKIWEIKWKKKNDINWSFSRPEAPGGPDSSSLSLPIPKDQLNMASGHWFRAQWDAASNNTGANTPWWRDNATSPIYLHK